MSRDPGPPSDFGNFRSIADPDQLLRTGANTHSTSALVLERFLRLHHLTVRVRTRNEIVSQRALRPANDDVISLAHDRALRLR